MFLEDIVSALDLTKAFFFFSLFLSLSFSFSFSFCCLCWEKKITKEIDPLLFKGLVFVHFS